MGFEVGDAVLINISGTKGVITEININRYGNREVYSVKAESGREYTRTFYEGALTKIPTKDVNMDSASKGFQIGDMVKLPNILNDKGYPEKGIIMSPAAVQQLRHNHDGTYTTYIIHGFNIDMTATGTTKNNRFVETDEIELYMSTDQLQELDDILFPSDSKIMLDWLDNLCTR